MPSVPLDPDDTGPPAEPPGEIASLFPVERARLTELLAGLERADWDRPSPCPQVVARLDMTTEQAWRLLTNNLPGALRAGLTASGDAAILGILRQTRAIIGIPRKLGAGGEMNYVRVRAGTGCWPGL